MRPIKFRVWIKEGLDKPMSGKMLPVDGLEWDSKGAKIIYVDVVEAPGRFWEVDIDKCELMQFTGLHDKDGAEIYEGDIVYTGWGVGQIIYKTCFGVYKKDGELINLLSYLFIHLQKVKVIGNIYENQELLPEETP